MIHNVGTRVLNQYLIEGKDGYLLVDTGYPGGFEAFEQRLDKEKIRIEDIRCVFVTHAHDDHVGFLHEVVERTDAQVMVHPLAVHRLKQGQNSFNGGCSNRLAFWFCQAMKLFGRGEHRFPVFDRPDRTIVLDETTISSFEQRWNVRVLFLPGHTPDSIGLLCEDGSLLCGDAAMNNLPSRHRITIWIEDKDAFAASWETMLACRPSRILPSHGKPFDPSDLVRYRSHISNRTIYPLQ